jgi:hypothetical protein
MRLTKSNIEDLVPKARKEGVFYRWVYALNNRGNAWLIAYEFLQEHFDISLMDNASRAEAAIDCLESLFDDIATENNLYLR